MLYLFVTELICLLINFCLLVNDVSVPVFVSAAFIRTTPHHRRQAIADTFGELFVSEGVVHGGTESRIQSHISPQPSRLFYDCKLVLASVVSLTVCMCVRARGDDARQVPEQVRQNSRGGFLAEARSFTYLRIPFVSSIELPSLSPSLAHPSQAE